MSKDESNPFRAPDPRGRPQVRSIVDWLGFSMRTLLVAAVVVLCLLSPLAVHAYRESQRRAEVSNELRKISEALENYHPEPEDSPATRIDEP